MWKSFLKKLAISALVAPFVAVAQAKPAYQPPRFTDTDRLAKIQAILPDVQKMYQTFAQENHFAGYAFGIVVDGKLIYTGSGGYANLTTKTPVTAQSVFRIASMTKSFTAMAILKLRDEGKLRLDDPASLYIPALKNQALTHDAPTITIRDLLSHSAGLGYDDPWGDRHLAVSNADLLAMLQQGLQFSTAAETAYEYSNLAFAMLGYIIQEVSGMTYQHYIAHEIWQPLGMQQAEWEYTNVPANALVHGYKWSAGEWHEQPMLHDGAFGAMGGMLTSVEAFARYMALHQAAWPPRDSAETGPVKRSSIREMHRPWRFNDLITDYSHQDGSHDVYATAYGYGLRWRRDAAGVIYVGHTGGLPGFGSNWLILPDYGIGVVFFANNTYAPAEKINLEVLHLLVKAAHLTPRELPASSALKEKQQALLKFLPTWKNAEKSPIFAENFFLDQTTEALQHSTEAAYQAMGKILRVGPVVASSQVTGSFVVEGEKATAEVVFSLAPIAPARIQSFKIHVLTR